MVCFGDQRFEMTAALIFDMPMLTVKRPEYPNASRYRRLRLFCKIFALHAWRLDVGSGRTTPNSSPPHRNTKSVLRTGLFQRLSDLRQRLVSDDVAKRIVDQS